MSPGGDLIYVLIALTISLFFMAVVVLSVIGYVSG
jgi:hypothetical protein